MNLNHLAYFRVLGNMEHYTKAANALNITQPSLSHAIRSLEEDLGTELFEKQGRNIKLTKYGKQFHSVVEKSLSELEEGAEKLRNSTARSCGQIDLAFIHTLGYHYVPLLIKDFKGLPEQEDAHFSFTQTITQDIIQGLKEESYDVGLCSYVKDDPLISFTKIHQDEFIAIVPLDHPLANYDTLPLARFKNEPLIYYDKANGLRAAVDELFEEIKVSPTISCEVLEDSTIAGLVGVGYGVAIVPDTPLLSGFSVKKIKLSEPIHNRYIYMATLKNHYLTPSARSFCNFLVEHKL